MATELTDHEWQILMGINETVQKIDRCLSAHLAAEEVTHAAVAKKVASLFETVNGNGKPGLKHEVAYLLDFNKMERRVVAAAVGLILSNIGLVAGLIRLAMSN